MNWVGEGGAYLLGKEAHTGNCKYRTRDAESKHSLGNRWEQTEAVRERLGVKTEKRAARNEKRKRTKAETTFGEGTDGSEMEEPKTKSKRAKTRK